MFSNLIFLIIALLVISLAPENMGQEWPLSPILGFLVGLVIYGFLLILIYLQNRRFKTLTQLELIAFLSGYHYLLGAHRIFPNSLALVALFSLLLYFGGLMVSRAFQLRILIPFVIPFLLFSLLIDLSGIYPATKLQELMFHPGDDLTGTLIIILGIIVFMGLMMFLLPPLIQKIWKCKPLEDSELRKRLERLCQKATFKYAKMHTWTVMNHQLTAGIIGVIPRYRYVMFSKRLLDELSPESIEAIMAHEIGHSYRKHLLIYPIIFLGIIVCTALFSLFFSETIDQMFGLGQLLSPSPLWKLMYPFAILVPYGVIIALYFRFVFGFFSRQFERQADLHVFELGIDPEHMIEALNYVGVATGNSHHIPNWHHFSIKKRMNFLSEAAQDHTLIQRHHKRVRWYVTIYLVILVTLSGVLFPPISSLTTQISNDISDGLNAPMRRALAEKYFQKYQLKGDLFTILTSLEESFKPFASALIPGVAEYYAANTLFNAGEYSASAVLMTATWETFDFKLATPEVIAEFSLLTEKILMHASRKEAQQLEQAYKKRTHHETAQKLV